MESRWLKQVKEYAEALFIALLLALFIRTFIVQAFKIPSGSMLETLLIGDHLLVNKFGYGVRAPFTDKIVIPVGEPKRGDIVVFEYPEDPSKDFIKRVVAVPGDSVEIRAKQVFLNNQLLNEPFIRHTDPHVYPRPDCLPEVNADPDRYFDGINHNFKRDNMPLTRVPEGKYFVMGDNRDESHDSRFWGFVDRGAILGKALIIYWSWEGLTDIRWERIGKLVD
ncbi:MAG: signal peptidase I [Desulfovibrionaceae bacterium]|nr:signal peptidase I [Desulfovibrionaceae bacterium]